MYKCFKCDELDVFKEPTESQGSLRKVRRSGAMLWEMRSERKTGPDLVGLSIRRVRL